MEKIRVRFCLLYNVYYICAVKLIELNMDKIIALCKKYRVAKLWVFGSILTDRFNDDSDVDLLVIFDRSKIELLDMADVFFDFKYELEDLFKREVDLTVYSAIQNKYFKQEVDEKKILLWSAA